MSMFKRRKKEDVYVLIRHFGQLDEEILAAHRGEFIDPLIPILIDHLEEDYVPEPNYKSHVKFPPMSRNTSQKKDLKIKKKDLEDFEKYLLDYFVKHDIYKINSYLSYEISYYEIPQPVKKSDGTWGTETSRGYGRGGYGGGYGSGYGGSSYWSGDDYDDFYGKGDSYGEDDSYGADASPEHSEWWNNHDNQYAWEA